MNKRIIMNFYWSINENIDPTYPKSRHSKITSWVKVTRFLILENENSIEVDIYIIWMIMYDYKLASTPRIIGVMRARLTDNTLMESRRISTLRPIITSKTATLLRALVTSPRREECTEAETSIRPSIPEFNFEKVNPFLPRNSRIDTGI